MHACRLELHLHAQPSSAHTSQYARAALSHKLVVHRIRSLAHHMLSSAVPMPPCSPARRLFRRLVRGRRSSRIMTSPHETTAPPPELFTFPRESSPEFVLAPTASPLQQAMDALRAVVEDAEDGSVSPPAPTATIKRALALLESTQRNSFAMPDDKHDNELRVFRALANEVRSSGLALDAGMEAFLLSRCLPGVPDLAGKRPLSLPVGVPVSSSRPKGTGYGHGDGDNNAPVSPPPNWMAPEASVRPPTSARLPIPAQPLLAQAPLDWAYDIDELDRTSHGHCLSSLFLELVARHNLHERLADEECPIDEAMLGSFLRHCEGTYGENAYHNRKHAADVVLGVHRFICEPLVTGSGSSSLRSSVGLATRASVTASSSWQFSGMETLAALFAAAIHDFQHPGSTNAHEIRTDSVLAVRYHDRSVLESHSLATAFASLLQPGHNFLTAWSREAYMAFRTLVGRLVLLTDLAAHVTFVEGLKALDEGGLLPSVMGTITTYPLSSSDDVHARSEARVHVLATAIKAADLGHTVKPFVLHERWTRLLTEEFYALGDLQRTSRLPISTLCDRHKSSDTNVPHNQIGFLRIVCRPFYAAVARVLPGHAVVLRRLDANIAEWEAQLASGAS